LIRAYEPNDYDTVSEWVAERELPLLPTAMLPSNGVVYFDENRVASAAAWVYLDMQAGVGFPHWMVSRKGMSLAQSRVAVAEILGALKQIATINNVHTLIATVHEEGIARECLNQFGWHYLGQGATLFLPCPS
jgi:hypothetical protein